MPASPAPPLLTPVSTHVEVVAPGTHVEVVAQVAHGRTWVKDERRVCLRSLMLPSLERKQGCPGQGLIRYGVQLDSHTNQGSVPTTGDMKSKFSL